MNPTQNPTLDLIHQHRSIRTYKPQPVPDEHIRQAISAGQAASTSSAIQAYCTLHVTDTDKLDKLAELCGPQDKVKQCGAFLIICADTRRHRLMTQRAGSLYDAKCEAFLLAVIDASLFAQNMVLAFESMNYGVCYIGGLRIDLPAVDKILAVPQGIYPLFGLCVGVPDESPSERPRLDVDAVLYKDIWPDDNAVFNMIDQYDGVYRDYLSERGVKPETVARGWSGPMAHKFAQPRRPEVGAYYRSKGADLS